MELRLGLLRSELFVELLRFELSVLLRLDRIFSRAENYKRVFYYSVELFCLILLDYSVWKMYQTIFFFFFFLFFCGMEFFLSYCDSIIFMIIRIRKWVTYKISEHRFG
jgi:hypothetical protein